MSVWDEVSSGSAKDELVEGLVSGELDESFEVIREYMDSLGGRKIPKNAGLTVFFLPWIFGGLFSVGISFIALFNPEIEVGFLARLLISACSFIGGFVVLYIGWTFVSESVDEVIYPDDYEEWEITVFFHSEYRYLAEIMIITDATDEDIIGDITFLTEIFLTEKSEIICKFSPGGGGADSAYPATNNFYVSNGSDELLISANYYLSNKNRVKMATDFSVKLGIEVADPLVV